ncbi:MAG: tyrosine-type recombinase/integrase, partial [Verrucomicrobiota bacterium]
MLSRNEIKRIFSVSEGTPHPAFRLMYGAGLRKMEFFRLRVKDVDFERNRIEVREGKGNKDRYVMLPQKLRDELSEQVGRLKLLWEQDREAKVEGVQLPYALRPGAGINSDRSARFSPPNLRWNPAHGARSTLQHSAL